ncbi:hypothetical protein D3C76_1519620 [compost metagenome]
MARTTSQIFRLLSGPLRRPLCHLLLRLRNPLLNRSIPSSPLLCPRRNIYTGYAGQGEKRRPGCHLPLIVDPSVPIIYDAIRRGEQMKQLMRKAAKAFGLSVISLILGGFALLCVFGILFFFGVWYYDNFM